MSDARTWAREARLLVVLDAGTRDRFSSEVDDVLAVDFLLQHPSLLVPFVDLSDDGWQVGSLPPVSEMQSSEEALLRWKRAVGGRVVAPMLGRLIARHLATHVRLGVLATTSRGSEVAAEASAQIAPERLERVLHTAAIFRSDPMAAHERLRLVLADATV